jgi:glycosyltransferase involved in cell wall biosynthesis
MNKVQVQIVQHLKPGGIETLSLDFCQQTDVTVYIVSLEGNKKQSLAQWPRLKAYESRLFFLDKKPGWSLTCLYRLIRLLRRLRPSAVHTHHIGPMLYGGFAARLAGVPALVHTEHDAWHLNSGRHRQIVSACLTLLRPLLVADAQTVADRLRELYPKQHCEVIENGINTKVFNIGSQQLARRALDLPQQVPLIGCAARFHPVKGHQNLLNALLSLPPNVHLALAGSGELEVSLKAFCTQHGLQNRVHFLGHLDQMVLFYQALDLFCLSSEQEGMPLSALEAQACGKHVVLTDVGGCRQCIGPDSGVLVPPAQPEVLARGLAHMLSQPACTAPRSYVVQQRSLEVMLHRYQQLIHPNIQAIGG